MSTITNNQSVENRIKEQEQKGRDNFKTNVLPILLNKLNVTHTNYRELKDPYLAFDVAFNTYRSQETKISHMTEYKITKKRINVEIKERNINSYQYNDVTIDEYKFDKLKQLAEEYNNKENNNLLLNQGFEKVEFLFCCIYNDRTALIFNINNINKEDCRQEVQYTYKCNEDIEQGKRNNPKVFLPKEKAFIVKF